MTEKLVEYLDWSDRSLEKHETGVSASKYANFDNFFDEETGDLYINLRRNTEKKRDFTIIIMEQYAKELYEQLKEKYGQEL